MSEQFEHVSVLLHESVDGLAIKPDGIYIDGTFGRGGHSRLILSKLGENGRLYSIDCDPQAIAEAQKMMILASILSMGLSRAWKSIWKSVILLVVLTAFY